MFCTGSRGTVDRGCFWHTWTGSHLVRKLLRTSGLKKWVAGGVEGESPYSWCDLLLSEAGTWGRGPFENTEDWESPPFALKQSVTRTSTGWHWRTLFSKQQNHKMADAWLPSKRRNKNNTNKFRLKNFNKIFLNRLIVIYKYFNVLLILIFVKIIISFTHCIVTFYVYNNIQKIYCNSGFSLYCYSFSNIWNIRYIRKLENLIIALAVSMLDNSETTPQPDRPE